MNYEDPDMFDVLIVGAGPAGLTLACDLVRRGVECRVIDRSPELFVGSRAKGLQPRTQEGFDDLGVIDTVRAAGAVFPNFRCYDGERVIWERTVYEDARRAAAALRPHRALSQYLADSAVADRPNSGRAVPRTGWHPRAGHRTDRLYPGARQG